MGTSTRHPLSFDSPEVAAGRQCYILVAPKLLKLSTAKRFDVDLVPEDFYHSQLLTEFLAYRDSSQSFRVSLSPVEFLHWLEHIRRDVKHPCYNKMTTPADDEAAEILLSMSGQVSLAMDDEQGGESITAIDRIIGGGSEMKKEKRQRKFISDNLILLKVILSDCSILARLMES